VKQFSTATPYQNVKIIHFCCCRARTAVARQQQADVTCCCQCMLMPTLVMTTRATTPHRLPRSSQINRAMLSQASRDCNYCKFAAILLYA